MAISAIGSATSYGGTNAAAWSAMQTLSLQRAQIKNGSYGRLLKAYVNKVGNKAALEAYRTTGSAVASVSDIYGSGDDAAASSVTYPAKKTIAKSTFLDDHLKSIGKTNVSRATAAGTSFLDKHLHAIDTGAQTGLERAVAYAEGATGRAINADGIFVDLADKYKTIYDGKGQAAPAAARATAIDITV